MSDGISFSDLINIDELRSMLRRLFDISGIPVLVFSPEGSFIAGYDGHTGSSRRRSSRYSCIKASLAQVDSRNAYHSITCSHQRLNLIFPIAYDQTPLAFMVLFHLNADSLKDASPSTDPDDRLQELAGLYLEYARMLADRACVSEENLNLRKAAEEKSHIFDTIIHNLLDMVWMMDLDFKMTFASSSVMAKRGYTFEELREMSLEQHLTPDSYRRACELMVASLQMEERESQVFHIDMEYLCKDGGTFWTETRLRFVRDLKGDVSGILGVGREIHGRVLTKRHTIQPDRQFDSLAKHT